MLKSSSRLGENFYRYLAEATPGMVVVYNIQTGQYVYVNSGIKKILGFEREDLLKGGIDFIIPLVHPDDLEEIIQKNNRALALANRKRVRYDEEPIVSFEYRLKDKRGRWHWVHTDGSVFSRDQKGKVDYVLNISHDITARKKVEVRLKELTEQLEVKVKERTRKLRASEEFLELSQRAGKIGAFEWFIKTGKVYWTPELEELYGLRRGGFKGTFEKWQEWVHPEDVTKREEKLQDALKTGEYLTEFRIIRADKTTRWILARGEVYFDKKGHPERLVGINMDITERKSLERQKDDFIGIASHELKTPVATIKGYTQILQQFFSEDEKVSVYLTKMNNQLSRLTALVSDLLDVSKVQAGKLELNLEEFDLNDLIKETVEDLQPTAKQHRLIVKLDGKLNVKADKYRLSQVLVNLISNAIKYSPKAKEVLIRTETKSDEAIVEVKDFGIGISEKEKDKIFERFYQVSTKIRPSYSGLGLGLYISNEIIRRHKGGMWVESEKGKGSSFFFKIPKKYNSAYND